MLKMQVINRAVDGLPLLQMVATDKKSKKKLTALHEQMQEAQYAAIPRRMADIYNTCGSGGSLEGIDSIAVGLLLGGIEVKKRQSPKIKKMDN